MFEISNLDLLEVLHIKDNIELLVEITKSLSNNSNIAVWETVTCHLWKSKAIIKSVSDEFI